MDDSLRRHAQASRSAIASGELRGSSLVELVRAIDPNDRDVWVDELLGFEDAPPDVRDLPRGSVPYLPCGVDEILAMVCDVPLRADDHFVDLGSGIGRVAILAHLITGARASGIEIQEPLVRAANARSEAFALTDVTFVHANAADWELEGSFFFLYAPFNGAMLASVLRRIEAVAWRRSIIVCTVGLELRDVKWLAPRASTNVTLSVYESETPR